MRVFFLHMPKCGGQTLARILDDVYPTDTRYATKTGPLKFTKQELMALPSAQKEKLQLVKGHFNFGIHEVFQGPFTYFTFLRNPVTRVISHYNYAKRTPGHYLYTTIHNKKLSIIDYVTSGISNELSNGMTRILTAQVDLKDPSVPAYGTNPPWMLEKAKENLQNYFCFAGITEEFDRGLEILKKKLGWNFGSYSNVNVAPENSQAESYSENVLPIIQSYNQLDLQLYDFVNQRFRSFRD